VDRKNHRRLADLDRSSIRGKIWDQHIQIMVA
jgi:hypothetical protein